MNPDGKCYAFDSRGLGYGRGEGVATVLLKRLSDALKAGDPIRAIIRGSSINQDGYTNGIASPSLEAQESLISSLYQSIGINPRDIGYVEAHGTGTVAGDVTEVRSIASVFCENRDTPLIIGSIKSNIGHLEAAGGIAGLIKAIMILEKGYIPPNINLINFKQDLDFEAWKINVSLDSLCSSHTLYFVLIVVEIGSKSFGRVAEHLQITLRLSQQFWLWRHKYTRYPTVFDAHFRFLGHELCIKALNKWRLHGKTGGRMYP